MFTILRCLVHQLTLFRVYVQFSIHSDFLYFLIGFRICCKNALSKDRTAVSHHWLAGDEFH